MKLSETIGLNLWCLDSMRRFGSGSDYKPSFREVKQYSNDLEKAHAYNQSAARY